MTELKLESLSPSAINQLRKCPRQWMYTMQSATSVIVEDKHLIFGRTIHGIIASYYNMVGQNPTAEIIRMQAEKAFERWYKPEIKTMQRQANDIEKNFINFELQRRKTWQQYKPTFVEKKLIVKPWHDLPEFHPIIDFYSEPAKTIIDWKTGIVDMNEDLMLQGKIYELAIKAIGKPVEHVIFFSLKQGQSYEMPKIQDGWVYKICHDTMDLIASGRFPKKPTILCSWCPFILNCEFDNICLWDEI